MGVKNLWNKLVGNIGGFEEDDEFETDEQEFAEAEEEQAALRHNVAPPRRPALGAAQPERPMKMMIVEPETFDDSQSIADYLRDRKPVVINFESTDADVSKRVVDFISGATYALDGNIQKVGKDIFLCVPSNVTVDRNKRDYADFTQLAWKNTAPSDNLNEH
ncbi:cell division protein SepF [Megasphaera vaginalis (ex Bordigoni et al. 2020)]|uniref:cell division protein SepF n=1 Tax=Megasphaera vaginalis (ex Bordigoni et al. 2020) TaxID=2045301 RepID=UPI000C7BCA62|nr:cell division protein SepF [Megasphaera vaginalis (ex Bordigoni et al. 2020)]